MPQEITCANQNCKSCNVRSYDSEPLSHPTEAEVKEGAPRYDNELYVKFRCLDCGQGFTVVFELSKQV